jgi:hypothetical protein
MGQHVLEHRPKCFAVDGELAHVPSVPVSTQIRAVNCLPFPNRVFASRITVLLSCSRQWMTGDPA